MSGGDAALVDPVVARPAVVDRRRALLDAARLFSCAVALGAAAAALALVLFIPWIVFGAPGFAALPVLAAASAGAGAAVAQYFVRTRGQTAPRDDATELDADAPHGDGSRRRGELRMIVGGALLGSLVGLAPIWLTAWSWRADRMVFIGAGALPWWIGVGVVLALAAMAWSARRARTGLSDTGESLAGVLMAAAGVVAAFGLVAASAVDGAMPWIDPGDLCLGIGRGELTRQDFPAQAWCWQGDRAIAVAPRAIEAVQVSSIAVAAILLLAALLVWFGVQSRPRAGLVAGIAGAVLVVASVVIGLVVAGIAPTRPATGAEQPRSHDAGTGTGFPGEKPQPQVDVPPLEESRRQFAALAAATTAAVGSEAIWRDPKGPVVSEAPCEGGVMLTLDGEFAMGVITDTSTDEHDREVTEGNLDAAQRIGSAWRALGMTRPESLHGEQHFGGGVLGSVEHAQVGFAFGVAQPHIDGRCVPLAG